MFTTNPGLGRAFIVGAMKSGTTSLFRHLAQHPAVAASDPKETKFFCQDRTDQEWEVYASCFPIEPESRWALEASTDYTKFPRYQDVAARMHRAFPDARLIYLVRDPIERIYSHYTHNVIHSGLTRPFDQAVRDNEHYIEVSSYQRQLAEFQRYYSHEQLLVIQFERLQRSTTDTLQRVLNFLALPADFAPLQPEKRHHASSHRSIASPLLRTATRYAPGAARRVLRSVLPPRWLRRPAPTREQLSSPQTEQYLVERLGADVDGLVRHFSIDLNLWSPLWNTR